LHSAKNSEEPSSVTDLDGMRRKFRRPWAYQRCREILVKPLRDIVFPSESAATKPFSKEWKVVVARDKVDRIIEKLPVNRAVLVQAMRAELQTPFGREIYQERSQMIQRRLGQIKQHDGFRRWIVWELQAVRTRWASLCATLNLRLLYKRCRQGSPASPKATGAMTVRAERPGILLAPVLL
jgi:hypothetical protein